MPRVAVQITRLLDPAQPGWVECVLVDVGGRKHHFVEKVPVVTSADLAADSSFPARGEFACVIIGRHHEGDQEICTIDTEHPHGIESTKGIARFDVASVQLEL